MVNKEMTLIEVNNKYVAENYLDEDLIFNQDVYWLKELLC